MSDAIEQDLNIFPVQDEVERRVDDPAAGGGFVFAAVRRVQSFERPERIMVTLATALEYDRYA
jgi:hypothetical protein